MTTKSKGVTLQRIFDYVQYASTIATTNFWKLLSGASDHLNISLNTTVTSADVIISNTGTGNSGLRFSTATDSAALVAIQEKLNQTLNFGAIATNTSVDITLSIASVDATYVIIVTPNYTLPVGISVTAFWDPAVPSIKIRASNTTAGSVTVNGTFNILALKVR